MTFVVLQKENAKLLACSAKNEQILTVNNFVKKEGSFSNIHCRLCLDQNTTQNNAEFFFQRKQFFHVEMNYQISQFAIYLSGRTLCELFGTGHDVQFIQHLCKQTLHFVQFLVLWLDQSLFNALVRRNELNQYNQPMNDRFQN